MATQLFENGFRDPNGTKHAIPLHVRLPRRPRACFLLSLLLTSTTSAHPQRDIVDFLNTRPEEKAEHSPARGRRDSVVG